MNPLLGFTTKQHAPSRDEEDQKERSSKRVKGLSDDTPVLEAGGDEGKKDGTIIVTPTIASKSFKESVIGDMLRKESGEMEGIENTVRDDMEDDIEMMVEGQIEEKKVGDFEC
jgi:hypothetical protein